MTILGVDIAGSYQAGISIHQLKADGMAFVACKATEGTTYAAPHFDEWINAIKAEGMVPGAYHFLRRGNGAAQARWFLSKLAPHGGPAGMVIQLDCEADAAYQDIVDFVTEWNAKTGHYPFAFYTGDWWLQPKGWNIAALTPYLWAAPDRGYTGGYTGDGSPDWNAGYGGYAKLSIDQYTSKGNAGGITGNVDIDAIRDPAVLAALTRGGAVPSPVPSPAPAPHPGTLAVNGQLDAATIRRWQQIMGTPADGVISRPSDLVRAVQRRLNAAIGAGLAVDGDGIRQDGHSYRTVKALQRYLGTVQDGVLSTPVSECVKAVQRRLNEGWF